MICGPDLWDPFPTAAASEIIRIAVSPPASAESRTFFATATLILLCVSARNVVLDAEIVVFMFRASANAALKFCRVGQIRDFDIPLPAFDGLAKPQIEVGAPARILAFHSKEAWPSPGKREAPWRSERFEHTPIGRGQQDVISLCAVYRGRFQSPRRGSRFLSLIIIGHSSHRRPDFSRAFGTAGPSCWYPLSAQPNPPTGVSSCEHTGCGTAAMSGTVSAKTHFETRPGAQHVVETNPYQQPSSSRPDSCGLCVRRRRVLADEYQGATGPPHPRIANLG